MAFHFDSYEYDHGLLPIGQVQVGLRVYQERAQTGRHAVRRLLTRDAARLDGEPLRDARLIGVELRGQRSAVSGQRSAVSGGSWLCS